VLFYSQSGALSFVRLATPRDWQPIRPELVDQIIEHRLGQVASVSWNWSVVSWLIETKWLS
jgi:hypothetical protein